MKTGTSKPVLHNKSEFSLSSQFPGANRMVGRLLHISTFSKSQLAWFPNAEPDWMAKGYPLAET